MLQTIHHIAIICSDYPTSKTFYTEILGLEIIKETYREERKSYKLDLALNVEGHVNMSIFNIRGQVVEVLVDRNMQAGYHNIAWNADGVSSGMYFVKVETGANAAIQKLMLLK